MGREKARWRAWGAHYMKIVPLELRQLNKLVSELHRHHKPVQGHRFSIGVEHEGKIIGGCSIGRTVSRMYRPNEVVEVTRLVSDGTKNVCSMLYSAAARAAKAIGYKRIQTYILDTESGVSLKASGWYCESQQCGGGNWVRSECWQEARRNDQPQCFKQRWVKDL